MKELIRHILKEETSVQKKVKSMIDKLDYVKTSKVVGGFSNLKKILGDDYFTKTRKIDLIKEVASEFGDTRGILRLSDFDVEITIGVKEFDDGSYQEKLIRYVESDNGGFFWKTYEYDEDGVSVMVDQGYGRLILEDDIYTNELFDALTSKLLE